MHQVRYPDGTEHTQGEAPPEAQPASPSTPATGQLVRLRIPHRIWADELPPAPASVESAALLPERTALGA